MKNSVTICICVCVCTCVDTQTCIFQQVFERTHFPPPFYFLTTLLSLPLCPVFTPKVIGVAIARYDYSSRQTRELSLQEGDVVKIYTKSGANGWWRGEVNGRVSSRLTLPEEHSWHGQIQPGKVISSKGGCWPPAFFHFLKKPENVPSLRGLKSGFFHHIDV